MDSLSDASVWVPILAVFIPVLTALAVKPEGSSTIRAGIAIVAACALAVVDQIVNAPDFTVSGLVVVAITALVVQVGAYLSFWKPLADINNTAVPSVGIG